MRPDLVTLLRCPDCGGQMTGDGAPDGPAALTCQRCGRAVPVVRGIPRFVGVLEDDMAKRTQASFGYEWTHFNDWRHSGERNFNDYFQGVDLAALGGRVVLDAGCGMGRHARQIAKFAGRVIAVDFSRAIDQASRNVSELSNVDCVQADLLALPLADESCDFVYSLGVLHHLANTECALASLVRKIRRGGRLRVYLYWKRPGWKGRMLAVVTSARRITTKIPFALLRVACRIFSLGLYALVVMPYRALSAAGVRTHEDWPLFVYSRYSFNVLENDQFDRFSAPIEKRYDAHEVHRLLEDAGLTDVTVRGSFGWIGDGMKPLVPRASPR